MQFHTQYTWSRDLVAAWGTSQAYLLVEWRGMKSTSRKSKREAGNASEGQVQLRLSLGTGVRLVNVYGCRAESFGDHYYSFLVGSGLRAITGNAVFRFEFSPRPSGMHQVILAEWTCIHENGEQILAPGNVISLQFSNQTSAALYKMDLKVEKNLKFLQNPAILVKALKAFEKGLFRLGEELILRRADEMLLHAARQLDADFLKEAEMLYGLGRHFGDTYGSTA